MLFIILGFVTAVYSQVCDRITPRTVVDMDNLGLAQSGCSISNIIKPYAAANLPWNPSSVPSRGYYKISMTFQEAKPLTSCDFWASTDGSHNPTGVKFYDRPAGTLLSSTQSFTTRMTSKNYNFLMIPELNVSSIYIEVYKSTTWQLWLDAISCNTCYMPSDSITASPSRSLSPTRSSTPTPTSIQTASITVTVAPTRVDSSKSLTPTESETHTPSLTPTVSETRSLTTSLTPTSANSETVSPSPSLTATKSLTVTRSLTATRSLTTTKSLTESLSTTLTETLSPSLTPTHSEKQNISNISNIYIDMSLPLSNSTGVGSIITQLAESPNVMILGGVAVGVGSLSFLIIAAQYLSKKFAPGPDGKRPSISSVASSLFSSAKEQATTVLKEVSEDVEQAIKKEVSGAMKDPKSLLTYAKNPNGLLNSVKGGLATSIKSAVAKNGATSESSVVLKMIDKVLPGQPQQVPAASAPEAVEAVETEAEAEAEAPVAYVPSASTASTTGAVTTIQIDPEHLEAIQKMLELMNKPHLVVTTSPPNEPSL